MKEQQDLATEQSTLERNSAGDRLIVENTVYKKFMGECQ